MDKILDHFDSIYDFENTLFRADDAADNPIDGDFMDEMLDMYEDCGEHMYLLESQANRIKKLSEGSCETH